MSDQDPKNKHESTEFSEENMQSHQEYDFDNDDEIDDEERERLKKINEKIEHLFEEGGELHDIDKIQAAQQKLAEKQKEKAKKESQASVGNFSDTSSGKKTKFRKKITQSDQHLQTNQLRELEESSFLGQYVNLSDYIFLPDGLQFPLMFIYFLVIPYGMGLLILFLFVADQDISTFLVFDIFTVIPVWSIGYEAVAATIMFFIIKAAVMFNYKKRKAIKKLEDELRKKMRRMDNVRTKFG